MKAVCDTPHRMEPRRMTMINTASSKYMDMVLHLHHCPLLVSHYSMCLIKRTSAQLGVHLLIEQLRPGSYLHGHKIALIIREAIILST